MELRNAIKEQFTVEADSDRADELANLLSRIFSESLDYPILDLIVMTQACDLENDKVSRVVLCSHISLSDYRSGQFEPELKARKQNPTEKAWTKHINAIQQGHMWNLHLLNADIEGLTVDDYRVVDFNQVYSLPREFLEAWTETAGPRSRLNPPYREHLSQAFARYFMRVGLPEDISLQ